MTKSPGSKHVVLYADDDKDDLFLVEDAFQQYTSNVELVTVPDGTSALDYLNRLSPLDPTPCLIILDINMPGMNGKETLKEIRNHTRFQETPVVLFTTSSYPKDRSFAENYNAGFITKPLDAKQMATITSLFIDHCNDEIRKLIRRRSN